MKRTPKDPFARAASTEPEPLPTRFISAASVEIGEGVQFTVDRFESVVDRFSPEEDSKVVEITGTVVESRARRVPGPEVTVTCKSVRLAQMAEDVAAGGEIPGAIVTLVRGEDEGQMTGWRWSVDPPEPSIEEPA